MKRSKLVKGISLFLIAAMAIALLPALGLSARAANEVPVITLRADTAINPIIDFHATKERGFSEGGPFTVTMEWRAEFEPMSATQSPNVSMVPIGYDTNGVDQYTAGRGVVLTESCDWTQVSWTFENCSYYLAAGGEMVGGGIVRLLMWYAYGEVQIRNVVIRNASGKVMYDMNKDADIAALLTQMDKDGMDEIELDNLQTINRECYWVHAKFGTGNYTALLGRSGTSSGGGDPQPSGPVFEDPTTPQQTEPQPVETEPVETEPEPVETDPEPTQTDPQPTETEPAGTDASEPEPTQPQPTEPAPGDDGGLNTGAVIGIAAGVIVVLAGAVVGVLFATGKLGKKKD